MGMTQTQQFSRFCPWWPWPSTLTFKIVRARDQARLPCEFGANPVSGSRDIWGTNRQKSHSAKNRTLLAWGNKTGVSVNQIHSCTDTHASKYYLLISNKNRSALAICSISCSCSLNIWTSSAVGTNFRSCIWQKSTHLCLDKQIPFPHAMHKKSCLAPTVFVKAMHTVQHNYGYDRSERHSLTANIPTCFQHFHTRCTWT